MSYAVGAVNEESYKYFSFPSPVTQSSYHSTIVNNGSLHS